MSDTKETNTNNRKSAIVSTVSGESKFLENIKNDGTDIAEEKNSLSDKLVENSSRNSLADDDGTKVSLENTHMSKDESILDTDASTTIAKSKATHYDKADIKGK